MLHKLLCAVEGIASGLRCLACGAGSGVGALCDTCDGRVGGAGGCIRCGRIDCLGYGNGADACDRLWLPYRCCSAAAAYAPPMTDVVLALKKSGSFRSLEYCADRLVGALPDDAVDASSVTWVPAASTANKGFDHGELLAQAVSRRLGVPSRALLRRKNLGELKGLGRRGRVAVAGSSFAALATVRGGSILLVDDVTTTGASLYYAALELKGAGARAVYAAAVARTLPAVPSRRLR